jgi:hypothetical protein
MGVEAGGMGGSLAMGVVPGGMGGWVAGGLVSIGPPSVGIGVEGAPQASAASINTRMVIGTYLARMIFLTSVNGIRIPPLLHNLPNILQRKCPKG